MTEKIKNLFFTIIIADAPTNTSKCFLFLAVTVSDGTNAKSDTTVNMNVNTRSASIFSL